MKPSSLKERRKKIIEKERKVKILINILRGRKKGRKEERKKVSYHRMILVVPVESFLTKFTNVWPGVAVYRLVLAQSRQLPESFAASLAFKVSLVGVRWQMPHQRVLMPELLRTWIVNVKLSTDSRKFRTVLFFFQIFPF